MTPFAELLRRYRKNRQYNQQELATLVGIDQSYLSALETGQKKSPSDELIQAIVETLELSEKETFKLKHFQKISSQNIIPPSNASLQELEFISALSNRLGGLSEDAIQAMHATLNAVSPKKVKEDNKMRT